MMLNKGNSISDDSIPIYALTGANGHIGKLVLTCLLDQVPPKQIIATTRKPELLSTFIKKGVTVRQADFNDAKSLPVAFSGATRLLIISTNDYPFERRYPQQRAAILAAVEAGVHHIINTLHLPIKGIGENDPHRVNENEERRFQQTIDTLSESGVTWTTLIMNSWTIGAPYMLQAMRIGDQVFVPKDSGKPCWLTREDYARTAVSVLTGKAPLKGNIFVTGPESLGIDDLAQRWSDIHNQKLEVHILPNKEVIDKLVLNGMPFDSAQKLVNYCVMFRQSEMPVTDIVEQATGKPATSVDGILSELVFD